MDSYFIEILIIYTVVMTTKQGKYFFSIVIPICLAMSTLRVKLNEHTFFSYLYPEEKNT